VNATFNGIALSEREVAALAALDALANRATGDRLARAMQAAGHTTSVAAARQAGAALTRKGVAAKCAGFLVQYEITNQGREWIAQYRRMGGTS
jgi:hypothetical protein